MNRQPGMLKEEEKPLEQFIKVPISQILMNPHQPRKLFKEEEIRNLANSIKEIGLIHPLSVRKVQNSEYYELISGERRLRASKSAGLKKIPVIVRKIDALQSAETALIENIQREDLCPLEIAQALQFLIEKYQFNQETLAKKIGKQRSTIANYLRLLSLSESIQISLKRKKITMGHAKAILSLKKTKDRESLNTIILKEGLTVRQTESFVKRLKRKIEKKKNSRCDQNFYLREIEEKLQQTLGSKVSIQNIKGKKGKISIDYYDWDDLERLLNLMNCNEGKLSSL